MGNLTIQTQLMLHSSRLKLAAQNRPETVI